MQTDRAPGQATPPVQHIIRWNNRQLFDAWRELQALMQLPLPGSIGYKATLVLDAIQPMANALQQCSAALIQQHQRTYNDGDVQRPVPTRQDNTPLPPELWARDAAAFRADDAQLMDTEATVALPVAFTYEELAGLTIRGEFWRALKDVIVPPRSRA